MIVSASTLSAFQVCPRKYLLSLLKANERRWRPRSLFQYVLRNAVQQISNGESLAVVRNRAAIAFMERAAKPGLDVSVDPYELACDFAAMCKTVLTRLYPSITPGLKPAPTVILSPAVTWSSRVLADQTGMLHSWSCVDSLNDNVLAREFHSWHVLGEIAVTGMPMVLHIVEIGRQSGSHQVTPWCRAYAHPVLARRWAFQSKGGKSLGANWRPVWFQDSRKNDPDTWVELMTRDEVNLVHDVPVRAIAPAQGERIRADILKEAAAMDALQSNGVAWSDIPMRRTSCDVPPCFWQSTCYKE